MARGHGEVARGELPEPQPSGRGRVIAIVWIAVLLPFLVVGRLSESDPPRQLVLEPDLLAKLQTLADGLHHEIVLCLTGDVRRDTAWADDFGMPVPVLSTTNRSSFERCPNGTLATWHNHPLRSGQLPAASGLLRGAGFADASRLCALSSRDTRTVARLRHPFAVVAVDLETWCWWSLDEVRAMAVEAGATPEPELDRTLTSARHSTDD